MNFVDDIPRPTLELSSTKSPLSSDEAMLNFKVFETTLSNVAIRSNAHPRSSIAPRKSCLACSLQRLLIIHCLLCDYCVTKRSLARHPVSCVNLNQVSIRKAMHQRIVW